MLGVANIDRRAESAPFDLNRVNLQPLLKPVQVIVCLHIFPIFSFLAKMLSSLSRNDNIFARNENIGKICKRTIT